MNVATSSLSFRRQKGAALVVALILLTAITVIGLSNMQSSSLEVKMVTSQFHRTQSFANAESGLRLVEQHLESGLNLDYENLFTDRCGASSSGDCFTSACPNGLCFFGEYEFSDTSKLDCEVGIDGSGSRRTEYWTVESNWSSSSRYGTVDVVESDDVKYMIEFLCFVGENIYSDPTTGDPLFLITILYEPSVGQPIMLQSTYSFEINL